MSKRCWKNGTDRVTRHQLVTNLQSLWHSMRKLSEELSPKICLLSSSLCANHMMRFYITILELTWWQRLGEGASLLKPRPPGMFCNSVRCPSYRLHMYTRNQGASRGDSAGPAEGLMRFEERKCHQRVMLSFSLTNWETVMLFPKMKEEDRIAFWGKDWKLVLDMATERVPLRHPDDNVKWWSAIVGLLPGGSLDGGAK